MDAIIEEASVLVSEHDLHLASNSLDLLSTLACVCPSSKPRVQELVIPRALDLVQSPLLQGTALQSLQSFFVALADHYHQLFSELMGEIPGKTQQLSTARCIAALCCKGQMAELTPTVQTLLNVGQTSPSETMRRLALLCLGEIGRLASLSVFPDAERLMTQSLADDSEDIKSAASYALGALTLGNLPHYLPGLVEKIRSTRGHQRQLYLLLQSLNEVISSLNQSNAPDPISPGTSSTAHTSAKCLLWLSDRTCRGDS